MKSWINLPPEDPKFAISERLRSKDLFQAVDIGLVEQMRFLLRDYAPADSMVLDPFAGLGSTLIACHLEGHKGIGIEIEAKRVSLAQQRFEDLGFKDFDIRQGNASCLTFSQGTFDLILGSLPYYGADRKIDQGWTSDAGHLYLKQSFDTYMNLLATMMKEFHRVLKPGGLLVLAAENIRVEGSWTPLAWLLAETMAQTFRVHDERVIIYTRQEKMLSSRFATDRSHEYVLVGEKLN